MSQPAKPRKRTSSMAGSALYGKECMEVVEIQKPWMAAAASMGIKLLGFWDPPGASTDVLLTRALCMQGLGGKPPTLYRRLGAAGEPAVHLLSRMLTFDPSRRCSAEEALAHEYFADLEAADGDDSGADAARAWRGRGGGAVEACDRVGPRGASPALLQARACKP
jgi:hypothetical protein